MAKINAMKASALTLEPKEAALSVEAMQVVKENPQLASEIRKVFVKGGFAVDVFDNQILEAFPGDFILPTPPNPTTPTETQVAPTGFEIDTRLQLLISSIPIAHPGNIITSEYHNALRDAVRALASKIGLSVNPAAEYKILTLAPNFLPMKSKSANLPNLSWDVTLERAANPSLIDNNDFRKTVAGGFVVQLPDGATIHQMMVRGVKAAQSPDPTEFKIGLRRHKLGTTDVPQELILIDLKDIEDGVFTKTETVKLTDTLVADIDEDEGIASKAVNNRKTIRNDKWIYFVTAEFLAGDNTAAEKYEINSIQIFCIS